MIEYTLEELKQIYPDYDPNATITLEEEDFWWEHVDKNMTFQLRKEGKKDFKYIDGLDEETLKKLKHIEYMKFQKGALVKGASYR